ncbi:hypothetical protein [Pelagicoccus sp. SDUM812003]|uniref:hypothetical protein n=1 Tax=Pelagicoccus sp. SDUM812003 TaxID=3041267 RepID=UPI00280D227A|nr:hypothetical protein [Pelagicoccus sp. SDUM812003]MDQ8202366.1 hypothetical protein [Pelagicoccus sp. SDUM812003]
MKTLTVCFLAAASVCFARASDYSESVLTDLQGVGLEVRQLNVQSEEFELEYGAVEEHALRKLEEFDVRLLSAIELDVMPGQPYLEVAIDVAHAQGPSHLFVVKLELREMAKLDRPKDRIVSMSVPTWERKMMGVANRPEAILEALDRLLRIFSDEYHLMNRPEE